MRSRWFNINLAILYAITLVGVVAYQLIVDPGIGVDVAVWSLWVTWASLIFTLPPYMLYLALLWRRRTRRAAMALAPLLLLGYWWLYADGFDLTGTILVAIGLPAAVAAVRV